jgi:hypothetical protein
MFPETLTPSERKMEGMSSYGQLFSSSFPMNNESDFGDSFEL